MGAGRFYEQVMGVYFDDLDAFHILHNARYLLLFERTLGSFWEHIGMNQLPASPQPRSSEADADRGDHDHLVRTNSIEYLRPVRGTQKVRVRLWIDRLGTTSLVIAFRLMPLDVDLDCAVGTRTLVRVDPNSYRPTPWSATFRERVQPWVHSSG